MPLPLLISAVAALSVAADTSRVVTTPMMPTVMTTPVIGIHSRLVADSIVVEKSKHSLTLYQGGFAVRTYGVALGKQPQGDKVKRGDNRTPEGVFRIDFRNADSKYHRALHISYPDVEHLRRAAAMGVTAGGDVMIHGLPKGYETVGAAHREFDWTEGCVAVTNAEIEEIWSAIPDGTPIQIKP
jgi:murein L,D-transpeptidase YafK